MKTGAPKREERERMAIDPEFKEEFDAREGHCGNDMAYAYYVSFVFLSSFIVSLILLILKS